jgi:hypothetical protein
MPCHEQGSILGELTVKDDEDQCLPFLRSAEALAPPERNDNEDEARDIA